MGSVDRGVEDVVLYDGDKPSTLAALGSITSAGSIEREGEIVEENKEF